jgi:PAS domain S-box-containing protein
VDKFGKVVSSTDEKFVSKDFSGQDVFVQGIPKGYGETCVGQPHYSPDLNENCIFISAPIISNHGTEALGVIINVYNLITLNEITTNRVGMGETGEVYLVSRDKLMITQSRFIDDAVHKQVVDTEPVRKLIEDGKETVGIYRDYRGKTVVGASIFLPEYGWTLLAEMDKGEAFAPLKTSGIIALIFGVVGAGAVTAAGINFAVSTSIPIKDLKDATERLAGGDLDHRVTVTRKDEIGALARSFNSMAEELKREITEHKQAEEALRVLNDSLEQRIAERISALVKANKELKVEIAERERIEEELRKLSNAVKQSPCSVIITDIKGNIEYINPKFSRVTGYAPEEVIGQNPRILKSGEKPPEEYKGLWNTITTGGEWEGEFHNKRKNGELYWEYASISPIRNPVGVITHFVAIKEDITERKRMEEEIKNVAKFPSENPYPVLRVTHDGIILYANPCSTFLLGDWNCEVGQFLPDSLCKVVSDSFITKSMKKGVEIKHRDQIFSFTIVPVTDTAYVNLYGVDVTEHKRAEEELRKQRDHLEYLTSQLTVSNKELEAFCYSVSHDLRAPLRSINGFCKALMEDYPDKLDTQGKNYLQRVNAASQRMGQLIDDLLNLSRITRSEMRRKTVDLSALAKKIATELREAQPERQAEFIIAEKLIAYGDPQLLRIVLTNLLGNAWKFTGKRPRARIEFGVTKHDGKPVYFVRDNGDGFDMAFVNKLFGAFHRLHSTTEFEGTGIGLATVQRIIHRHGGQIWAEGAVDQGATFYFTFTI